MTTARQPQVPALSHSKGYQLKRIVAVGSLVLSSTLSFSVLAATPADADPSPQAGCENGAVLSEPMQLQDVLAGEGVARGAQAASLRTAAAAITEPLAEVAKDDSIWLDTCGQPFVVEPLELKHAAGEETHAEVGAGSTPNSADVLKLHSRPGASRKIYLDFTGHVVTGTEWNVKYGTSFTAEPFSLTAPADTSFSAAEQTAIQQAWQVVAEDYAPFDVDVTTEDPGDAGIRRTDEQDLEYGIRVVVTKGTPVEADCGCGGMAYIGTFSTPAVDRYNVAFAFSTTMGSGVQIGEVISHEAGHTFGLQHDGKGSTTYYNGHVPWAPIMGAGYYEPVTQWSKGEYEGANQFQDDVTQIATHAPTIADDHGDTADAATAVSTGSSVDATITTRKDVDAFSVDPGAKITVTATPATYANLDLQLKMLDSDGKVIFTVNPAVQKVNADTANGLGATWTGSGAKTVLVDGVGEGSLYSDYASLGDYTFRVASGGDTPNTPDTENRPAIDESAAPLYADPVTVNLVLGQSVNLTLSAIGGAGSYDWAAKPSKNWPEWLTLSESGQLSGTPPKTGSVSQVLTVTDGAETVEAKLKISTSKATEATSEDPLSVSMDNAALDAGADFSRQVTVSGASEPVKYSAKGLPSGLKIDKTGLVAGKPKTGGTFVALITATAGSKKTGIQYAATNVRFDINWPEITVPKPNEFKATAGKKATIKPKVAGGTKKYAWRAAELPSGVTLDPKKGSFIVVATAPGTLEFEVTAYSGRRSLPVTLTVNVAPAPLKWAAGTATSVKAVVGQSVDAALTITGGDGQYSWTYTGTPVAGISVSASGATFRFSGTPTAPGKASVAVSVTDGMTGKTVTKKVSITVK